MRRLPAFRSRHFPYRGLSLSSTRPPLRSWARMESSSSSAAARRRRKVVVVMGATGCGKTKLSVELASTFFPPSEIINSDKIQVYRGLDVTTNKIPLTDRRGVPHHLLGESDSPEFTPSDFRSAASLLISQIHSRRGTPFVVGGSNSFIHALLAEDFDPESDAFGGEPGSAAICSARLRYSCCFIWVDVSPPVLSEYLSKRVDEMLDSGMYEELAEYFGGSGGGGGESDSVSRRGLRRAIGIPEFEKYFQNFPGKAGGDWTSDADVAKRCAYEEAVWAIKDNTCQLAKRQLGKILRLRDSFGWDLKRVDATAALRAAMGGAPRRRTAEIWGREVVDPSVKIVNRFLME